MSEPQSFQKKKSLGQHFLTSDVVPKWMCDAADLAATDTVLEIGPGTGVLTREILNRGAKVIALEADRRAIAVLEEEFEAELATGQLCIQHADARELDLVQYDLPDQQFKVVANIPYYLSGHLFRACLESRIQPSTLVFLVQKEVAARIAREQKESLLSLSVKAFGVPKYIRTVGKGHFSPPPKIDSAIIAISDINLDNFTDFTPAQFFTVLHLGFGQKRKQLLGNLTHSYDRATLTNIFSTLNLPLDVRAEDVSLENWLKLVGAVLSTSN